MTDDYPRWICLDCGLRWGRQMPGLAGWHRGDCDLCGRRQVEVTEPRDFGHLVGGWRQGRPDAGGFVELDECTELIDGKS